MDFRRKSIWEALKIDTTHKTEFSESTGQVDGGSGGIIIEEGIHKHGVSSFELEKKLKEEKHKVTTVDKSSGDASFVHLEREGKGSQSNVVGADGEGGTVVHVEEDLGDGSRVHTIHRTWNTTSTGPTITRTFYKNTTTYIGPDGKEEVYTEYTPGHPDLSQGSAGQHFHSSSSGSSGGGTSVFISGGSQGSNQQESHSVHHDSGTAHGSGTGGQTSWSSSGERVHSETNYDTQAKPQTTHSTSTEERYRPGEVTFSSTHIPPLGYEGTIWTHREQHSSGQGSPTFREEPYHGAKPTTPSTKHFAWNGDQQSGNREQHNYDDRRNYDRSQGGYYGQSQEHSQTSQNQGNYNYQHGSRQSGERQHHYGTDSATNSQQGSQGGHATQETDYEEDYSTDYDSGRDRQGQSAGYNHSYQINWGTQGGGSREGHRDRTTYGKYDGSSTNDDYASQGLGAAAVGHGFRTATLDLGTLGSSNSIDNNRNILEAHTVHYDPDLGKFVEGSSSRSRVSYGSNEHVYGGSAEGQQSSGSQYHGQGSQHSNGQGSQQYGSGQGATQHGSGGNRQYETHHEYQWSSEGEPVQNVQGERDNVHTDRPETQRRFHGRRRRQAPDSSDATVEKLLACKSAKCFVMRCTVGPLENDKEAFVALRFRSNVKTIHNVISIRTHLI